MERLIEKNRTYRIPKEDGTTELLHVLSVGENVILKDVKTGNSRSIKRSTFQSRLDNGEIYVSASLLQRALKRVVAEKSEKSLRKELMDLASGVIQLEYDKGTETELLNILEDTYDEIKGNKAVADISWEENIKKNKEKQERIRQQRKQANERVKQSLTTKTSKEIADGIKDLQITSGGGGEHLRIQQIRQSLQKINDLMQKLRKDMAETTPLQKKNPLSIVD